MFRTKSLSSRSLPASEAQIITLGKLQTIPKNRQKLLDLCSSLIGVAGWYCTINLYETAGTIAKEDPTNTWMMKLFEEPSDISIGTFQLKGSFVITIGRCLLVVPTQEFIVPPLLGLFQRTFFKPFPILSQEEIASLTFDEASQAIVDLKKSSSLVDTLHQFFERAHYLLILGLLLLLFLDREQPEHTLIVLMTMLYPKLEGAVRSEKSSVTLHQYELQTQLNILTKEFDQDAWEIPPSSKRSSEVYFLLAVKRFKNISADEMFQIFIHTFKQVGLKFKLQGRYNLLVSNQNKINPIELQKSLHRNIHLIQNIEELAQELNSILLKIRGKFSKTIGKNAKGELTVTFEIKLPRVFYPIRVRAPFKQKIEFTEIEGEINGVQFSIHEPLEEKEAILHLIEELNKAKELIDRLPPLVVVRTSEKKTEAPQEPDPPEPFVSPKTLKRRDSMTGKVETKVEKKSEEVTQDFPDELSIGGRLYKCSTDPINGVLFLNYRARIKSSKNHSTQIPPYTLADFKQEHLKLSGEEFQLKKRHVSKARPVFVSPEKRRPLHHIFSKTICKPEYKFVHCKTDLRLFGTEIKDDSGKWRVVHVIALNPSHESKKLTGQPSKQHLQNIKKLRSSAI